MVSANHVSSKRPLAYITESPFVWGTCSVLHLFTFCYLTCYYNEIALKYLNEKSTRSWWPEGYVTRNGCKCQKKVSFRRKHIFEEGRVQREWTNAVVCLIKFRWVGVDTLNEIAQSFNVALARTSARLEDKNLRFSFQRGAPLSLKFPHERSYAGHPVIHTQNAISVIAMRHNNENENCKLVVIFAPYSWATSSIWFFSRFLLIITSNRSDLKRFPSLSSSCSDPPR